MTLGLLQVLAGLLGLILGSAVTALAWRVPRGVSWVHGRSACPSCGHVLGARDLVPVLSWISTRGRCRHCGTPVSPRYPLTELWCAAWCVLVVRHLGLVPALPFVLLWGILLVALTWIDLDHQLLPDVLTLPGTLIGVAAAALTPGGLGNAMFGMLVGSGTLSLLAWGYLKVRKIEGMGGGDIKLAAMLGAVLGWKLVVLTFFLAALTGSLWGGWLILRKRGDGLTALPFGTLLCPAGMVAYLWGPAWIMLYFRMWRGG
jgi:leader peptidase (prepilin peptidase) / N-methyltransferase